MLVRILTEPGFGGLIVLAVLVISLTFYGGLVLWVASARPERERKPEPAPQPQPEHGELQGARP